MKERHISQAQKDKQAQALKELELKRKNQPPKQAGSAKPQKEANSASFSLGAKKTYGEFAGSANTSFTHPFTNEVVTIIAKFKVLKASQLKDQTTVTDINPRIWIGNEYMDTELSGKLEDSSNSSYAKGYTMPGSGMICIADGGTRRNIMIEQYEESVKRHEIEGTPIEDKEYPILVHPLKQGQEWVAMVICNDADYNNDFAASENAKRLKQHFELAKDNNVRLGIKELSTLFKAATNKSYSVEQIKTLLVYAYLANLVDEPFHAKLKSIHTITLSTIQLIVEAVLGEKAKKLPILQNISIDKSETSGTRGRNYRTIIVPDIESIIKERISPDMLGRVQKVLIDDEASKKVTARINNDLKALINDRISTPQTDQTLNESNTVKSPSVILNKDECSLSLSFSREDYDPQQMKAINQVFEELDDEIAELLKKIQERVDDVTKQ